ncbi:LLM class flavin-dependent oxidoreductase [Streptomyces sp. NTH33]|uniref:LLM class oxidoreductase n=1 Tax=Streptomyces sp. NTH33 TaxID=1735453 RepID=UPI000DA85A01|nr:LLM class oxidoreductase [Streptomyces sp. NTH33]PZH01135.1 LLM class flavin-dependent oxidoreductase [Streptomyces sp. NTH33]
MNQTAAALDVQGEHQPPFSNHPGLRQAFSQGRMTLGVITPLEGFSGPVPALADHVGLIQQAERAGFASVWVRDVPLLDPTFGDTGQVFDTWAYLGHLAATTERISLGTSSVVLPLHHPLDTAKAASSIDHLSGGRFLLGVATGDRPVEFPAYGVDYESRGERFRDSVAYLRTVTENRFPTVSSPLGTMQGTDLLPKPTHGRLPVFMTGRGRQEIEWIAEHTDGWLYYTPPLQQQALNVKRWRELTHRDEGAFKPFNQATYLDLSENPTAEPSPVHQGISVGREPLLELLHAWQDIGIDQLMLNFKQSRRPVREVIDELAQYVLPHFPPGGQADATADTA